MRSRVLLSLTGAQLQVRVYRPQGTHGIAGRVRSLLSRGPAFEVAGFDIPGPMTEQTLSSKLEQAYSRLSGMNLGPLAAGDLEVQLGLCFSRIGLMGLSDVPGEIPNDRSCDAYARAWVQQIMHLNPDAQLLRWEVLGEGRKLLISCIDRAVFDTLSAFAAHHGMSFASCRPAVLGTLSNPTSGVLVWTERGLDQERSNRVQLMGFADGRLSALWRAWIPPNSCDGTDAELEGVIRRFQSRHATGDVEVRRLCWPSGSPTG